LVAALDLGGCGAGGLPPAPDRYRSGHHRVRAVHRAGAREFRSAAAELDGLEQRLVACTDVDPTRCPQAVHDAGRIAARMRADVTCAGKVHSIIFGVRVMGSHVEMLLK
jgi:hypothetical protein